MEIPKLQLDSKSSAQGGTMSSPWNQGDFVVSYAGDASSSRTAPPWGSLAGAVGNIPAPLLIAGAIVLGGVLWRRLRSH